MKINIYILLAVIGLGFPLIGSCGEKQADLQNPPELIVTYNKNAKVFNLNEIDISFPGELDTFIKLPDTQVHDAYDADRDGVFIRVGAECSLDNRTRLIIPGFAMRDRQNSPWKWKIRWTPDKPGVWSIKVVFQGRSSKDGSLVSFKQLLPDTIQAVADTSIHGPLVTPQKGNNPSYLRKLNADGSSQALWLFGACRAWVVKPKANEGTWAAYEWIKRDEELLTPMREAGFNLLNQWMAPWEYLLIHHDKAEFWRKPDDTWERIPLPKGNKWSSYQCFDQGRAKAFDSLVRQCEGTSDKPPIYLLLSPLPHQCLQLKEHPWGAQESGWSPGNDAGKQTLEKLNGFSGFKKDMKLWDFFKADPKAPLNDWRSKFFDHQANFYRYMIARWSWSRAIGIWVIIDELDAVGDEVGVMSRKKGWWAHPECSIWLGNIFSLFRGSLSRSDGFVYKGDPYKHPLHAATTSYGGQAEKGSNAEWKGTSKGIRPDIFGWHWYPYWPSGATWEDVWTYTIKGVGHYAQVPIGRYPKLISEFGASDRRRPEGIPSRLYPSLYHFGIWSAVFTGQAGTPMDWDDGKEFGELIWRNRKGPFDKDHYPINHIEQVKAIRKFLKGISPEGLTSTLYPDSKVQLITDQDIQAYALYSLQKDNTLVIGWLYSQGKKGNVKIKGLPQGKYTLTWYDPWTGEALKDTISLQTDKQGGLSIKIDSVFEKLNSSVIPFPTKSRHAKGYDAAFKIAPQKP